MSLFKIFDGGDQLIFSLDGHVRRLKGSLWEPDAFATEPLGTPIISGQWKDREGVPVFTFGGKKPFSLFFEGATVYANADIDADGIPDFSGVWGNGLTAEAHLRRFFGA